MISNLGTYIDKSRFEGANKGVFADRDMPLDHYIEISPAILISHEEGALLEKTIIGEYMFDWNPGNEEGKSKGYALALGMGSLFNHSDTPNIEWDFNEENQLILFYTLREIKQNEELTINYGWDDYPWKSKV